MEQATFTELNNKMNYGHKLGSTDLGELQAMFIGIISDCNLNKEQIEQLQSGMYDNKTINGVPSKSKINYKMELEQLSKNLSEKKLNSGSMTKN